MIELVNIYKDYEDERVLNDINVKIKKNSTTILMGLSGSGKTTLANLLIGISKPDRGFIKGLSKESVSVVFQEDRLIEKLSPIANVRLVVSKEVSNEEITRHFFQVGINEELLHKPVINLSGGQRRRVAIVRAIIRDADFYCLDEPFKGLDEKTEFKTIEYIKDKTENKTVLIISHKPKLKEYFNATCINLDLY